MTINKICRTVWILIKEYCKWNILIIIFKIILTDDLMTNNLFEFFVTDGELSFFKSFFSKAANELIKLFKSISNNCDWAWSKSVIKIK